MSSIYEVPVDPDAENNGHAFALQLIGFNKSVLEVGCASGYFTKVMVERGCDVVGIEVDPNAAAIAEKWAQRVVVGDIDDGEVWDELKDESFDVVVLADVLEHLRDPLASLKQAVRKLKPAGFIVTSLPNIAHGDVRIALMQGTFRYGDFGLLDRTHLRFFTLESVRELLSQAGLVVVDTRRVIVSLFHSELGVTREDVSHRTLHEMLSDPEIESYQFVMKSVRDDGTRILKELSERVNDLTDQLHHEDVRTALLRLELRDTEMMSRHIEALEGHVSGLEHNIEVLHEGLIASEARYQAVLRSRSVRLTAPLRRIHRALRRGHENAL